MSVFPPRRKATTPRVNRAVAVLRVEEAACPSVPVFEGETARHDLRNDRNGVTRCTACGETWWRLDELLNRRGVG